MPNKWWWSLAVLVGCIEHVVSEDPAELPEAAVDGASGDAGPEAEPAPPSDAAPPVVDVPTPCIRVVPDRLEFEQALVGRTTTRAVVVESCGGQPLEVTAVFLTPASSPTLALATNPFALPPTDTPPPRRAIEVAFTPADRAAYGGTLVIESNDPARPRVEVPVVGRGVVNECPVAVVGRAEYQRHPLEVIELLGGDSQDPDGPDRRPARFVWSVIERPEGSTAEPVERFQNPRDPANTGIPDDPATPDALFFVDVAGRYVIELVVEDDLDLVAPSPDCPQAPAHVVIEAAYSGDGFQVELVWDTPADADQTNGDGTDMDLHLLHPEGVAWAQAPFDCYYANARPDWDPAGPAGDPTLDIDDVNGAGPEVISLREPEVDLPAPYCVGVDYYRAENLLTGGTWGPSTARVRVYLEGELVSDQSRLMESSHQFWEPSCIVWRPDDRRVLVVDRFYNGVP